MQKYTGGYILPKNHTQNYTRGIISRVGIFLPVTLDIETTPTKMFRPRITHLKTPTTGLKHLMVDVSVRPKRPSEGV